MYEVNAPDFSDTSESGTVLKWFKEEGDFVEKGDELLEIEVGDSTIIIESKKAGRLSTIFTEEGAIIEPEELLAEIDDEDTLEDLEEIESDYE